MNLKTILAIDPGSSKCGVALVRREQDGSLTLVWRTICPPADLPEKLTEARHVESYSTVVVGSGTHSRQIVEAIRLQLPSIGVLLVDERDTSLQARERYWEHNPRKGWKRLLPATLFPPTEPIDDFAALVLAERVLDPQ